MFCKLMMSIMQCTGRFFFFFFLELVNTNPISGLFLKFSEEEVCGERLRMSCKCGIFFCQIKIQDVGFYYMWHLLVQQDVPLM